MKLAPREVFLAVLAAGVAARALLLVFPVAATDVSYYNAQAVGYILRGVDPYGAAYSAPSYLVTPGAGDVFAYLPGVFAFLALGGAAALAVCDLVIGAALYVLPSARRAAWSAAFLLFPPFVLFSTSFPNDILPAMAFLAVGVALETRGSHLPSGVMWGLAFASSQAAWFAFPVYAVYSFRRKQLAPVAASLAVAGGVMAPFLAWDPGAFVHDVLLFQLGRAAVPLLSSGPFGVNVNPSLQGVLASAGLSLPTVVRGAAAVVLMAYLAWRTRGSVPSLALGGSAAVAGSLWLLSADFFWSYLELPAVLLFVWGALRSGSRLKETPTG